MEVVSSANDVAERTSLAVVLQKENARLRDLLEETQRLNVELAGRNLSLSVTVSELRCRIGHVEASRRRS